MLGLLYVVSLPLEFVMTVARIELEELCAQPEALLDTKVAITLCAALIVTVQVDVPLQPPPLQPVKVLLTPAVAVKVTLAPDE